MIMIITMIIIIAIIYIIFIINIVIINITDIILIDIIVVIISPNLQLISLIILVRFMSLLFIYFSLPFKNYNHSCLVFVGVGEVITAIGWVCHFAVAV